MGDFTVVRRDDGLQQWAYKGKPLYTFAGDAISGDAKGHRLDDTWHVALALAYFMPQGVSVAKNHFDGYHLTDRAGKTLYVRDRVVGTQQGRSYRFGAHVNPAVGRILGLSTCDAVCTKTWRPLTAPKDAQASGYWEIAVRDEGTRQWVYRGFPVYSYTGDSKPGDMKGIDTYEIMAANDPYSAADIGIRGMGAMVWHAVAP
jgi:predicted lipoprotein with Yx(FWY)xxD motif